MPAVMPKVLYLSHATGDVYDIIRAAAPAGLELVTLESNDDAERKRRVRECEVVIAASYPRRRDVIDCAERLRLVHHQGGGRTAAGRTSPRNAPQRRPHAAHLRRHTRCARDQDARDLRQHRAVLPWRAAAERGA